MATIGQVLATPESGWRRYDDRDSRIKYIGFSQVAESGSYSATLMQGGTGSIIKFKFYGTKLRLTAFANFDKGNEHIISIDGVNGTFNCYRASVLSQTLVYENTTLTAKVHEVIITSNGLLPLDAIDIDDTGYLIHPTLNQVSNMSDIKNVGDCIQCRYSAPTSGAVGYFSELGTTIVPEIPVASSAIPDGLFYWIYVGKDYLGRKKFITDRNIQHSISWDALNTAGICSELSLYFAYSDNLIPEMSSATTPSGIVTSSGTLVYNGITYSAYKAFDSGIAENEVWANPTSTGWLAYEFVTEQKIEKYVIYSNQSVQAPKSWTFEGWNGTSWVILDTQVNATGWDAVPGRAFVFNNPNIYKKYRINITSNNGNTYLRICYLKMMKKNEDHHNYSLRLPTGGAGATDTDNEWDKIIVNSTLNNKITPGDNNIWHWNITNLQSWASSTASLNTVRTTRGYNAIAAFNSNLTNASTALLGFRPVLIIEQLLIDKYLIKKDSNYYSILPEHYDVINNNFTPLTLDGITKPNKADIELYSFDNLNLLLTPITKGGDTIKPIDKLDNIFEIVLYRAI